MLALAHKNSNSLNHYLDDLINGYLHTQPTKIKVS